MFLNSGHVCIQLECSMGGNMTTLYVLWVSHSATPAPFLENLCPCVIKPIAHFQVALGLFTKVWLVLKYSYRNMFHLRVNEKCSSYERMSARTHFAKGAKGSTEILEKKKFGKRKKDLELVIGCRGIEKFKLII